MAGLITCVIRDLPDTNNQFPRVYMNMDASPQVSAPSCSENTLKQVVDQIFLTRRITRLDQMRFMNVIATQDVLSNDDRLHLNRVFDALKRGLLRVVD